MTMNRHYTAVDCMGFEGQIQPNVFELEAKWSSVFSEKLIIRMKLQNIDSALLSV